MPKSKSAKRKLAQPHPYNDHSKQFQSNSGKDISHEEIWDDSALLHSWNEAVAEYEFYHSIHAKGEDVDEVLRQHHAANGGDEEAKDGELAEEGEIAEEGEVDDEDDDQDRRIDIPISTSLSPAKFETTSIPTTEENSTAFATTHPESNLLDSTSSNTTHTNSARQAQVPALDQTLENIKMAYYWAGYYSGLYDGQKQAQATSTPETKETAAQTAKTMDNMNGLS